MASLQRVRNLDCILGQSLRRDQRMDVLGGLRERDRLHWLIPKANSCDSIVVPRGQGGLADALTVLPPGPVPARRYRDLVLQTFRRPTLDRLNSLHRRSIGSAHTRSYSCARVSETGMR